MKRKIIPVITLSSLVLSALVSAETTIKPVGWYVKGSAESFMYGSSNGLTIPGVGASLGYKNGHLRAEGQYKYGAREDWRNHDIGVNGYFDFDNSSPFSPYIGLGLHNSFYSYQNNAKSQPIFFNRESITSETLYAEAIVGIRAYLTNQVAFDLNYAADLSNVNIRRFASIGLVYHF